jgi:hypothetical protein
VLLSASDGYLEGVAKREEQTAKMAKTEHLLHQQNRAKKGQF